jgi:hypothetical protein
MTKAIETKWLACTNTKPGRIVAFAEGGNRHLQSVSCGNLTELQQEASAAYALARRLDWRGVWIAGSLPNCNTVFVNVGRNAGELDALAVYLGTLPLGSWFEIV